MLSRQSKNGWTPGKFLFPEGDLFGKHFAGEELGTTMIFDCVQMSVTGAKSATGS